MDRAHAQPVAEIARESAVARFCTACLYDISSLSEPRCPECGRDFNPHDPRSYLKKPIPAWRRTVIMAWGPWIALALLITSGFVYTVLPRPRSLFDWRLWLWLGKPTGVMHYSGTTHDVYSYYWLGDESRRESFRKSGGALAWRVVRTDERRYRVQVLEPDVRADSIMNAFNSIKGDWYFGVSIGRADQALIPAPFEITGDEPTVLGFLASEFGLPIRPFRLTEGQAYVWTFDAERKAMVTIDVTAENAGEFPLNPQDPDRVLIPRAAGTPRVTLNIEAPPPPDQAIE